MSRTVSVPGAALGLSTDGPGTRMIQLFVRVMHVGMIGGATTLCAEPFLCNGIPADVQVSHRSLTDRTRSYLIKLAVADRENYSRDLWGVCSASNRPETNGCRRSKKSLLLCFDDPLRETRAFHPRLFTQIQLGTE